MECALETESLVKRFGTHVAVDGLSLSVRRGEIYALLGGNGAGKTTTIRMLAGLVRPDSGTIRMFGEPFSQSSPRALGRVGIAFDDPGFYPNLSARENLELHARLARVIGPEAIGDALSAACLSRDSSEAVGSFSLGMRRRLSIARALINRPELLILDEPSNGLDPAGLRDLRALLLMLASERGTTVLLSTHLLAEAEHMADRVGVMSCGRLVDETPVEEISKKKREYVEFAVSDEGRAAVILERDLGISDFEIAADSCVRVFSRLDAAAEINRAFVLGGVDVSSVRRDDARLEDYFLGITEGFDDRTYSR